MEVNPKQGAIIKSFAQTIRDLVVANYGKKRSKRDLADTCDALKITSLTSEFVGSLASETSSVFSSLGIFGAAGVAVASGTAIAAYTTKYGVDLTYIKLGCDDIPFKEIKEIMDERFNKLDEAVDRNYNAILKVDQKVDEVLSKVQQTRIEMRQGFTDVLQKITSSEIRQILSDLKTFVTYFDTEASRIYGLSKKDYIARINGTITFLKELNQTRRPGDKTLYSIVYNIINREFAIPKSAEDTDAWSALFSLYYAGQTYVSVVLFLVKQYSRLANYYYNDGDLDKYNLYFNELQIVFENFQETLAGNGALIDRIVEIMKRVKDKDFVGDSNDLRLSLSTEIEALKKMEIDILEMELSIITDDVDKLYGYSSFNGTSPVEDWKSGGEVSYALQYKTGKFYSKIGDWTPFKFEAGKANPILRIPIGPEERQRLVFRKLNDNKAQLVGVIDDQNVLEFHDINRDLYNAASYSGMYEEVAEDMIETLILKGVDMNARFEHGRTAIHAAATGGSELVARILLDKNSSYVNMPDDDGYTPLHIAAERGYDKFIYLLIQYGVDVNAQTYSEKLTALHLAVRNGYSFVINALLEVEKINTYARDADGLTPLHLAVSRGISFVESLRKKNFEINVKTAGGITLLHMAAINKNLKFAEGLAKYRDLQVNSAAAGKFTPLHYAVIVEHLDMVNFLLEHGAYVNAATSTNWTPLHFAVSLRNEDIVKTLLVQQNIQIDPKADGFTPLHLAVASGQVSIVEKLLSKGANIQEITKDQATPLHIASMHKNVDMVECLLKNNAKLEEKIDKFINPAGILPGFTPLLTAALVGNLAIVEYLLRKGANIAIVANAENIFRIAATNGHLNVLKYLENKFDIATVEVLAAALLGGHLDVVRYLVDEKKVDLSNRGFYLSIWFGGHSNIINYYYFDKKMHWFDFEVRTYEWHHSVLQGNLKMLQYITKNKYDKVIQIIPYAIKGGQTDVLDYYLDTKVITFDDLRKYSQNLEGGAKVSGLKIVKYMAEKTNVRPDEMIPLVLRVALENQNLDLIKYLVKDVDINELVNVGKDCDSVLHCAVKYSSSESDGREVFRYLIDEKGATVNEQDRNGNTPLDLAIVHGVLFVIEFLISRGGVWKPVKFGDKKQEIKDLLSIQPHCNSIIEGKQIDIKFLGKNSRCIDTTKRVKDYYIYHTTPLILAITKGNLNLANELIDNGANIRLTDEAGNTPLHIAVENGYLDLTNKLIQKGADFTIENKAFEPPLVLAYKNFNKPIIDALNAAKQDYSRGRRSIQQTASSINVVKYLKNHGCHISDTSEKEGTPMCLSNLNGKQETIEFKNPLCLQHNLSLGLLVLQKFLDKKYPLPRFTEMNSEKSRTFALEITYKFESILRNAVKISHAESSSFDFYNLFRKIEANIRNEKFSNIPKLLVDFVNDVCTNEKTAGSMVDKIGKWFSKV